MNKEDIKIGQVVLYVKASNHIELGIVKSFNSEGEPFVQYHTGDTAACTPHHMLTPLHNEYAFQIIRKDCNNNIMTSHAMQIAMKILHGTAMLVVEGMMEISKQDAEDIVEFMRDMIETLPNIPILTSKEVK